jgi:protocatechuate 3,4-dioxygenase beta subunit
MRTLNENSITDAVLDQMAGTQNPRLKEIMDAAVRHMHAFAREVNLTPQEWLEGIRFFTQVGQKCTSYRQEFVLLSDVLGLSALVGLMSDTKTPDIHTDSSLLGPFYRQNSPKFQLGDLIAKNVKGKEIVLYGRVLDGDGRGVPHASIQVWQTDEAGDYDMQKPNPSEMDLRGTIEADAQGRYYFRSVVPAGYSIPMDGPVGDLIRAQHRHGLRPSHIHYLVGAPGCRELVTALYIHGDPHIDSDTVFGVTGSLVVKVGDPDPSSPFPNLPGIKYDFTLARAGKDESSNRVGVDPSQITSSVGSAH